MAPQYHRRVIRIVAEDSPNVRYGMAQQRAGLTPTDEQLVPGVLGYFEYLKRREMWDEVRQCIGLDANFWQGAEALLYPLKWLDRIQRLALIYRSRRRDPKLPKALGVDPGEGGANTSMSVVDELGLVELQSRKTPDTSVIRGDMLALIRKYQIEADHVCIDRGGGGLQIACDLRAMGSQYRGIRTIGFGEPVSINPRRGLTRIEERMQVKEERYAYFNRRAQMYGDLAVLVDPSGVDPTFAVPFDLGPAYISLRRQMALIPKTYDREGRLKLLPKHSDNPNDRTLTKIIGHSPDELDSLVLAVHALTHKSTRVRAGVAR